MGSSSLDFAIALTLVCDDDDLEDELVAEKLDELLLLLVDEYDEVVAAPPPVVVPPTPPPTPPLCETNSDIVHNLAASAPAVDRMLSNTSYLKHHNKTLLFHCFYVSISYILVMLYSAAVSCHITVFMDTCQRKNSCLGAPAL